MEEAFGLFPEYQQGIVLESPDIWKKVSGKYNNDKETKVYLAGIFGETKVDNKPIEKDENVNLNNVILDDTVTTISKQIKRRNYIKIRPEKLSNVDPHRPASGESVLIKFRDGDLKNPVSKPTGTDEKKRTSDRYRVFVADKNAPDDANKEYEILLDSNAGVIRIQTNNGRNEIDVYTIELNGKDGGISMRDTKENEFYINTRKEKTGMRNSQGTKIELDGVNINCICKGVFNIDAADFRVGCDTKINGNTKIWYDLKVKGDVKVVGDVRAKGDILTQSQNSPNHIH